VRIWLWSVVLCKFSFRCSRLRVCSVFRHSDTPWRRDWVHVAAISRLNGNCGIVMADKPTSPDQPAILRIDIVEAVIAWPPSAMTSSRSSKCICFVQCFGEFGAWGMRLGPPDIIFFVSITATTACDHHCRSAESSFCAGALSLSAFSCILQSSCLSCRSAMSGTTLRGCEGMVRSGHNRSRKICHDCTVV